MPDLSLAPRKILVTGGCGFIGSNFLHLALGEKSVFPGLTKIVNLDKLTYAGNPANLASFQNDERYLFVHADISEEEQIAEILKSQEIEAIVHFAAESHVDRSIDSPEPFFQTNVMGTLRLLNAARRYWKSLPPEKAEKFRFLHVSTDEVFGSLGPEDPAFRETTPYHPNSPYSASKASSDHAVRAYYHTYGLPVIITNCSNNYGPYQFPEKLIPLMILNALDQRPLPIYGDGGQIRDWLYVEDHCRAIALALTRGRPGETYAIGGDAEKTNLWIVNFICETLDQIRPRAKGSYSELRQYVTDRPGHDRRYAIYHGKISSELGWQPSAGLDTGLKKTISWYLEHRDWCDEITSGRYNRARLGNVTV